VLVVLLDEHVLRLRLAEAMVVQRRVEVDVRLRPRRVAVRLAVRRALREALVEEALRVRGPRDARELDEAELVFALSASSSV
jgi:hypothetical protein